MGDMTSIRNGIAVQVIDDMGTLMDFSRVKTLAMRMMLAIQMGVNKRLQCLQNRKAEYNCHDYPFGSI